MDLGSQVGGSWGRPNLYFLKFFWFLGPSWAKMAPRASKGKYSHLCFFVSSCVSGLTLYLGYLFLNLLACVNVARFLQVLGVLFFGVMHEISRLEHFLFLWGLSYFGMWWMCDSRFLFSIVMNSA